MQADVKGLILLILGTDHITAVTGRAMSGYGPGYAAYPGSVTVEVGDRAYYTRGPGYYVGRTYYVWRPGHWRWRNGQKVWIHGHYVVEDNERGLFLASLQRFACILKRSAEPGPSVQNENAQPWPGSLVRSARFCGN